MIVPGGFFAAVPVDIAPGYEDYTSPDFWQDVTGSDLEFVWTGEYWWMPYNGESGFAGLEVTASGANAGWQDGFRPSTITLTLNSGPNNGSGDGSFLDVFAYLTDTDDSEIATQSFAFTGYNQAVTHTFSIDFTTFDIARLVINSFLYLDTDGPFIELIDFA